MTRPFFSKDRISHFDLFDRHAGKVPSPLWGPNGVIYAFGCLETAINKIRERMDTGEAIEFQVITNHG